MRAHRARVGEQRLQARMLAHAETAAQCVAAQPVDRERHQHVTVQAQQRRGVAGKQRAHRAQQAFIALALGQFARQVTDQWNQDVEKGFCSHSDSYVVDLTEVITTRLYARDPPNP